MTAATALPELEERSLRLRGVRTRYFVGGAGPPLVLVHGLSGAASNWAELAPLLAERHRLLVPDLPGHGGSSPLPAAPSLNPYADVVGLLAEREGMLPAALVGHSMGGVVALRLALRRPTQVTALVLAAAMPLIPLVYGSDFSASVGLGYLLLPGVAAYGYGNILAATVVGKGRPEYALRVALYVTPPTLVMYATLIPALDAAGAALASVISYAATAAGMAFYFRRLTGLGVGATLPRREDLADYRALLRSASSALRRRRASRSE
jgi:pimeloyl-ACP methyl ester carboxylesterase